ncbi:MAG: DNA methyltransferase [Nitrososphaerota archaeon]
MKNISIEMAEFVSKLEEIMPAEELLFDPTPAFGKYKTIMPEESVQHPAKFNTNLVEFLIKKYTKYGDIVLDCMAGTGILGVIASLHGRHAIQVEIEEKFFSWMEKARENVEKTPTLTPKGKIVNICGDARKLSELISRVTVVLPSLHENIDVIITSPPYSDSSLQDYGSSNQALLAFEKMVRESFRTKGYFEYEGKKYTEEEWRKINKGELKPRGMPKIWAQILKERRETRYNINNPDNVSNLLLGYVDTIITSPPYEGSLEGTSRHTRGGIASRDPALARTGTYATIMSFGASVCYTPSPENIGNMKSSEKEYEALVKGLIKDGKPTYLSEMLKVYNEMYKVLKPGGKAIVVIKPCIKKKKVVDLPYYTWLLMQKVGFRLEKLYKLRLKKLSFWRVIFYKKHSDVPKIAHEYVIIASK